MITPRRSEERGHTKIDWLESYHTFSFDHFHDPKFMHFRSLHVLNEDWVRPGAGFPAHPHRDMEIITVVLEGALEHKDSMGNGSVIRPGDIQRMSAGTGITHSEFNPSETDPVHLLQMWILPSERGLAPSYEQQNFAQGFQPGKFQPIAGKEGTNGAVRIHQDAELWVAQLTAGERATHFLKPARHAWLQVARGSFSLNGVGLQAGDGAAVSDEDRLEVKATDDAKVLLFDLG